MVCRTLFFSFGKPLLLMLALFVIQLIGSYEGTTSNQARGKAWFVGSEGCKHAHARIKSDKEILVDLCWFRFDLIDHLDHSVIRLRYDSDLLDLLGVLPGFDQPPKL